MKKITIIASLVLMMVVGTSSAQAVTSRPRSQAPARAEATNSNMKILTLAADPATDPRHIVALLREIYINRKVPGIKKVGYSSADVTTPDSGKVNYVITDDYLDEKSWEGYPLTERNDKNKLARDCYNIRTETE